MGRPAKVKDAKVVSLRLPAEFLATKPENAELGDWLRNIIFNPDRAVSEGLNGSEKTTVKFFYNFFNELFQNGKLNKYLDRPHLLEHAEIMEMIVQ